MLHAEKAKSSVTACLVGQEVTKAEGVERNGRTLCGVLPFLCCFSFKCSIR